MIKCVTPVTKAGKKKYQEHKKKRNKKKYKNCR